MCTNEADKGVLLQALRLRRNVVTCRLKALDTRIRELDPPHGFESTVLFDGEREKKVAYALKTLEGGDPTFASEAAAILRYEATVRERDELIRKMVDEAAKASANVQDLPLMNREHARFKDDPLYQVYGLELALGELRATLERPDSRSMIRDALNAISEDLLAAAADGGMNVATITETLSGIETILALTKGENADGS